MTLAAAYTLADWSRVSPLVDLHRRTDSRPARRPCRRSSGPADDARGGRSLLIVLCPTRRCLQEWAYTLLTNNLHVRLSPLVHVPRLPCLLGGGASEVLLCPEAWSCCSIPGVGLPE
ncbi:hypothetical protein NDU88_005065 [Pleurodeles waltl]|uniref:Uncharacterized protein n=1 Tax=Pleurodeles waltl TaxID=8319 RepID=A0AAV7RJ48_PLEWA|nr:hypothetical protein NDU88_005065 [Pleurodeles waltl]